MVRQGLTTFKNSQALPCSRPPVAHKWNFLGIWPATKNRLPERTQPLESEKEASYILKLNFANQTLI